MSVLRTIEHTIEGLVERTFGRAFRSQLQPVELARKLAREMEQNKTVSVSQVYVPNEYTVYLSPADRERFSSFEASLTTELATYLAAYARSEGLSLLSPPEVVLETDTDLRLGEFGIACRTVDPAVRALQEAERLAPAADGARAHGAGSGEETAPPPEPPVPAGVEEGQAGEQQPAPPGPLAETALALPAPPAPAPPAPAPPAPPVGTPAYQPLAGVSGTQILTADEARRAGLAHGGLVLVVQGRRHPIAKRVTTIGRSRDNDLVIGDPNVSRRHAEVRHVGLDYHLVDVGSTNGMQVNGRVVRRHALADGDVVVLGKTEIRVEAG